MNVLEPIAFASCIGGTLAAASGGLWPAFSHHQHNRASSTFLRDCLASGSANVVASSLLNPMDISKTRMQMQVRSTSSASPRPNGMLSTLRALHYEGGLKNIWLPGLTATMMREMVGGSLRGGLYIPIRNALGGEADGSGLGKAAAAMLAGFAGGVVSNPLEIVKIRLLTNGHWYPSTFSAVPRLIRDEGLSGCARGLGPSVLRAAIINMGYLASYDHAKHTYLRMFGGTDSWKYHVMASLTSGVVATTVSAPFDMLKTRVMASTKSSALQALREVLSIEGRSSLFRGWVPMYLRLGPHSLISFPVLEQVRTLLGLGYL